MKTETFFLQDGGSIPNHPALPLVIYKEALKGGWSRRSKS